MHESELPITLQRNTGESLVAQLVAQLRAHIENGTLLAGESLPASRVLSARAGVARGVIVSAYEQLTAEGYLSSGQGTGTRVDPAITHTQPGLRELPTSFPHPQPLPVHTHAPTQTTSPNLQLTPKIPEAHYPASLIPGAPDTSAVATTAWRSAWRKAATHAEQAAPDLGDPLLRAAIADHLRRMRGTKRPAEDVIITSGARDGLQLLLTALGATQGRRLVVGVEDPGYASLRKVALRLGAQIVSLPVDADGLITSQLPLGMLDAVIVTPSHQYPLGGSLPLARRLELLAWAEHSGAVVIEDDYDSELRHSGAPLPTLAALDHPVHGRVAMLGTFSKTLSQSLAAGYLLAPKKLRTHIEPVRTDLGGTVSAIVQAALAELVTSGELRRHTAKMRRVYSTRRDTVLHMIGEISQLNVHPMSGGLHAVLELNTPHHEVETRLVARCHQANIGAVALSGYWQGAHTHSQYGLVIGAGAVGDEHTTFDQALLSLAEVLHEELSTATSKQ